MKITRIFLDESFTQRQEFKVEGVGIPKTPIPKKGRNSIIRIYTIKLSKTDMHKEGLA